MSDIKLTERSIEILNYIPEKYRIIIVNNIIAKSIETNLFLKECSYLLDSKSVDNISEKLRIKPILKTSTKRIKEKVEKVSKIDSDFEGFD